MSGMFVGMAAVRTQGWQPIMHVKRAAGQNLQLEWEEPEGDVKIREKALAGRSRDLKDRREAVEITNRRRAHVKANLMRQRHKRELLAECCRGLNTDQSMEVQ